MTRIIAGFAGSLTLAVPPAGTRPTSDRVREAIFSALDARGALQGANVLDLFAGSGALGLEAASRGAVSITLVERARAAAAICRRNAAVVADAAPRGRAPRITVSGSPARTFVAGAAEQFDVVLIDPPYDLGNLELEHLLEALVPRLGDDSIVVLERSSKAPQPMLPEGLELERRKDYGDTALYWLTPTSGD
ncbi:16S rRNA (guanine(966)-N(2))-methyltransferase RsmD [Ruicaihuangia caeni]|uniref:16S rRNA (Guanine(966)-N(2))-methyltransferase RsmD n=1 Tax=Ruicaihuangia caeni TaxID=3042517 RepID=A0AAW6T941_9MICO|nr:16S rRNA (guanine(966)-N(2))-methyltransferase RsmD [Klugiella sp. YN-L-19]MDI2097667.1 16S rRNA (guanine(966)-N(2))-methyltransferase RsmD [Klugiella sp. YN-L-19]